MTPRKDANTVTKRRDLFIMVPAPGRVDEAEKALSDWLREIDGHPGYLGGAVLRESAGELLPGTMVLMLEFESTEAARALWPKIEGKRNPFNADDGTYPPDQGRILFDLKHDHDHDGQDHPDNLSTLDFNRGNGLLARMLHVHAHAVDEHAASAA
jgi:hypothetical protein